MKTTSLIAFDFDQTITKTHTFGLYGLKTAPSKVEMETYYKNGKEAARDNIKSGLTRAHFEKNMKEGIVSIATYHNNPHFIAGHLSCLLEKELSFKHQFISNRHPAVAISEFAIDDGTGNTFLISYIFAFEEFGEALRTLEGKNLQIEFLQEILIGRAVLGAEHKTRFYDDSISNLEHFVRHFRRGTAHHVLGHKHDFQVGMHQHVDEILQCNELPNEGICGNLKVKNG